MVLRYGTPEEAGLSADRIEGILGRAERWVAEGVMPALVMLIARKGVIAVHASFGSMGPEPDAAPLPRDAIFPLDSLSKVLTATAAMIQVEQGALSLTRPVAAYIPEFSNINRDKIFVHHLLTYTSGLRDQDVYTHIENRKKADPQLPPCEESQHPFLHEHLHLGFDTAPWKQPGEASQYSSYGYNLLAEIVRRVSGVPFEDYVRERVCLPLGMMDTYFSVPNQQVPRIVRRTADQQFNAFLRWMSWQEFLHIPVASSGAFATALDIAMLGQTFLNQGMYGETRLLSPVMAAKMTRNQIKGIPEYYPEMVVPEANVGLGWFLSADNTPVPGSGSVHSPKAYHAFGIGGASVWVDPIYDLVITYFSVKTANVPSSSNADLFYNSVMGAII